MTAHLLSGAMRNAEVILWTTFAAVFAGHHKLYMHSNAEFMLCALSIRQTFPHKLSDSQSSRCS